MNVALFTHPAVLGHDTGPEHPECADRIRFILRALETPEFVPLLREIAPEAPLEALRPAHTRAHIDAILALPRDRVTYIDGDTVFGPGSLEAALRAAGGAIAGVDAVMEGWAKAAFIATRPPGHHAESNRAMGFCLFNNVAVAAFHARARWGLKRIAVADFDVHHGNGTQDIFAPDPDLFYASTHQQPCYPGTGMVYERGVAANVLNVPLPPGSGSDDFRESWEHKIIPALGAFRPELLLISAGFDAHAADPLAQLRLREADYSWVTNALLAVADTHCPDRVVSLLEGGYNLTATAASAAAHVRALMRL
ncbi:MAG TPA: histone deacetylase family protein [Acidocella sp.]|jgi:acetoin utilization deacetylase AcuC-like enzyme|uniref:histone deacetylase family protein n=1 Tax=Acidocella sp. TaxID=50710 RepID=UPI002C869577|nr:histone deacetylase family protein [Acidocella sp.]HVE21953.1 histone deacetylase family protein [Acidocella sp.]